MNRWRKAVRVALVCGALLALVALVGTLIASRLVDREALRQQIGAQIAQRLDAAVELQALHVSLWPLPHVMLHGLRLTRPGSIEVTVESASIHPALRHLLRGEVDIGEIRLADPEATIRLPPNAEDGGAQPGLGSAGAIQGLVAAAMAAAAAPAPDLRLVVRNGSLHLSRGDAPGLVLSDIELRGRLAPQQREIHLTCRSSLWDNLVVAGTWNPDTLIGRGRIDVTRLRPAAPAGDWSPDGNLQLGGDTEANLTMDIIMQGPDAVHADMVGAAPLLTLRRGSGSVAMKDNHLQASLRVDKDGLHLDVHDLQLDPPHLQLSGKVSMQEVAPALRIEAEATRVDVQSVRTAAAALAGDSDLSRAIFEVLRSGTASHLALQTHGGTWIDLGNTDALVIHGHLASGRVVVSEVPLELDDVDGDVVFAAGVLTADQVAARFGNTRAHDGSVRIGLTGGASEVHVESMLQADVADLLPLLKRMAVNQRLANELDRLGNLKGSISGKLVHDATATAFAGTLSAADGLTVTMDIANGEELHIKTLHIHDAQSDASFSLHLAARELELTFAGNLTEATMAALMPGHPLSETVSGDLRAQIALDEPARSTAVGQLTATKLTLPLGDGQVLHIDKVTLDATEDAVTIDAALDIAPDEVLQLSGRVQRSADAYIADLELVGTHADWDHLQPLFLRGGSDDHASTSSGWPQRLRGTLRAAVNSFTYHGLTWNPLRGVVTFTDAGPVITIADANLCGIETAGTAAITPAGVRLEFYPMATDQDLAATLACLGVQRQAVTGTYRLGATIAAEGGTADIVSTVHGYLDLVATHGRVYGASILGKVLSTLSVATGSFGNVLEITHEGMGYETLRVSGEMHGTLLTLNQVVFDGPSVKMVGKGTMDVANQTIDETILVAPFKSVDSVVSHIPWLGGAVGGTLISIPVHVSGPLDDPSITPLLPSAVGSELLGLIKKTLGLPTRLMQPLLPGKGKD